MRYNDIAQSNMLLEIGIMRYAASDAHDKHIVDFLERAQQSRRCIAGSSH